MQLPLSDTGR